MNEEQINELKRLVVQLQALPTPSVWSNQEIDILNEVVEILFQGPDGEVEHALLWEAQTGGIL